MERRKPEDLRVENLLTDDPNTALYRVVLNVIDACNRACTFCPRADKENYPNTSYNKMSLEDGVRLANTMKAMNFQGIYSITGWGEPLLHKDVSQLIYMFKTINPEARVELQTNGDPITPSTALDLFWYQLDKLVINIYDGPEQVAKFEEILASFPREKWTIQHKYDMSKTYGMTLNNRAGSFISVKDKLKPLQTPIDKRCYMPFYKIAVDWNLDTYFCDYDWAKRIFLGTLQTQNMSELWMCEKMREIREHLFEGNRSFSPCKFCDAEGLLYGEKQANVIMRHYEKQT